MGLLDKTLDIAKKASKLAIDVANKKIDETKKKRAEEKDIFIESIPYKYKYVVTQGDSTSLDLGFWDVLDRDTFAVCDLNNNPIFLAKGTLLRGKHHFIVTNPNREQLAKVHKHYINFSNILEREKRTCTIELTGEESFYIQTYKEFKERQYYISKNGWDMESAGTLIKENEFKFTKRRIKKPVISVYKIRSSEGWFNDQYITAFDDESYAVLATCLAIGVDAIRFSGD